MKNSKVQTEIQPQSEPLDVMRPEPLQKLECIPKSSKAPKPVPESFFVYLGPSIRGSVQKGAILPGTREVVEAQLQETIAKYPLMKSLLIPGSSIAEERTQVKTPGTLLNRFYTKLIRQLEGKE